MAPPPRLIEWARLMTPVMLFLLTALNAAQNWRLTIMQQQIEYVIRRMDAHIEYHLEHPAKVTTFEKE